MTSLAPSAPASPVYAQLIALLVAWEYDAVNFQFHDCRCGRNMPLVTYLLPADSPRMDHPFQRVTRAKLLVMGLEPCLFFCGACRASGWAKRTIRNEDR